MAELQSSQGLECGLCCPFLFVISCYDIGLPVHWPLVQTSLPLDHPKCRQFARAIVCLVDAGGWQAESPLPVTLPSHGYYAPCYCGQEEAWVLWCSFSAAWVCCLPSPSVCSSLGLGFLEPKETGAWEGKTLCLVVNSPHVTLGVEITGVGACFLLRFLPSAPPFFTAQTSCWSEAGAYISHHLAVWHLWMDF